MNIVGVLLLFSKILTDKNNITPITFWENKEVEKQGCEVYREVTD